MKTFIVGLEGSTAVQEEAFIQWITENGLGYWHWIPNFWIIQSLEDTHTVASIRDKITETFPAMNTLVVEIDIVPGSVSWSGYGPQTVQYDMFAWLNEHL
jgi:hypothetical protein